MGYDVTFHPIRNEEMQEFIFDVIRKPGIAQEKAEKISPHTPVRQAIVGLYKHLIDRYQKKDNMQAIGYVVAVFAGFLHPYWYARDVSISFLVDRYPEYQKFLTNFSSLQPDLFQGYSDTNKTSFPSNYTVGAFIPADKVAELKQMLLKDQDRMKTDDPYDESVLFGSMMYAIDYALAHGAGILEATDVVVPMSAQNSSNPANYRAVHLENERVMKNAREIDVTAPTARRFTNKQDA